MCFIAGGFSFTQVAHTCGVYNCFGRVLCGFNVFPWVQHLTAKVYSVPMRAVKDIAEWEKNKLQHTSKSFHVICS